MLLSGIVSMHDCGNARLDGPRETNENWIKQYGKQTPHKQTKLHPMFGLMSINFGEVSFFLTE